MYSPTSTIPTPRAHTWKGRKVLTKLLDSWFSDILSQPLFFEILLASSKIQAISPKARRYISPFITVHISIIHIPFFNIKFLYMLDYTWKNFHINRNVYIYLFCLKFFKKISQRELAGLPFIQYKFRL
ncbi:hypothetical protein MSWHS_3287 [Methanosarcina sp. WWM596]|nr:hypothetical protein MSWHS_3287 [Methanosarcina sp. WWM596]AKB23349.1 hypothetical protein MSWH1_3078 [Methanosarcina sp. WH1]